MLAFAVAAAAWGCTCPATVDGGVDAPSYQVRVDIVGPGAVRGLPGGATCRAPGCQATVGRGVVARLEAVPDELAGLVAWSGDCACRESTCELSVTKPLWCTVDFARTAYRLTLEPPDGGTIVVRKDGGTTYDCPPGCDTVHGARAAVVLTATPAPEHRFGNWSQACAGSTDQCTLLMTSDVRAGAAFVPLCSIELAVVGTGTGRIDWAGPSANGSCATVCTVVADCGQPLALRAVAARDSRHASWAGCTSTGDTCATTLGAAPRVEAEVRRLHLYSRAFPPDIQLRAVGSTRSGDWILAGVWTNSPVLDGVPLGAGNSNLLVFRMTPTGQISWRFTAASQNGNPGFLVSDLAVDEQDTIYVAAQLLEQATVGGTTLTPQSSLGNGVVIALDGAGSAQWAVPFLSANSSRLVSVRAAGGAVVAAGTHRGVSLGARWLPPPLGPGSMPGVFVASLTDAGVPSWLESGGVSWAMALDADASEIALGVGYVGTLPGAACGAVGSTATSTPALMRFSPQGACVASSAAAVSSAPTSGGPTVEFVGTSGGSQFIAVSTSTATTMSWGGTAVFAGDRGAMLGRFNGATPVWLVRALGRFPPSGGAWLFNRGAGGILEVQNVWLGITYDDFQVPDLGSVGATLFLFRDAATGRKRFHFLVPGTATASPSGPGVDDLAEWGGRYRVLGSTAAPVDFGGGTLPVAQGVTSAYVVEFTE